MKAKGGSVINSRLPIWMTFSVMTFPISSPAGETKPRQNAKVEEKKPIPAIRVMPILPPGTLKGRSRSGRLNLKMIAAGNIIMNVSM